MVSATTVLACLVHRYREEGKKLNILHTRDRSNLVHIRPSYRSGARPN